jgi:hypothetical protein
MTPDFVWNAGQSLVFAMSFYIGHISVEVVRKQEMLTRARRQIFNMTSFLPIVRRRCSSTLLSLDGGFVSFMSSLPLSYSHVLRIIVFRERASSSLFHSLWASLSSGRAAQTSSACRAHAPRSCLE